MLYSRFMAFFVDRSGRLDMAFGGPRQDKLSAEDGHSSAFRHPAGALSKFSVGTHVIQSSRNMVQLRTSAESIFTVLFFWCDCVPHDSSTYIRAQSSEPL